MCNVCFFRWVWVRIRLPLWRRVQRVRGGGGGGDTEEAAGGGGAGSRGRSDGVLWHMFPQCVCHMVITQKDSHVQMRTLTPLTLTSPLSYLEELQSSLSTSTTRVKQGLTAPLQRLTEDTLCMHVAHLMLNCVNVNVAFPPFSLWTWTARLWPLTCSSATAWQGPVRLCLSTQVWLHLNFNIYIYIHTYV